MIMLIGLNQDLRRGRNAGCPVAGWKPGIKDDVTCWVVRQTELKGG